MRLWSDDPSLPALHAGCERQQQQQQQQPDGGVPVTASQVSLGAGSSATGADSSVSDAVTAALQQLQEQHAGGSVSAVGSSSVSADGGAGAGGPGASARAAQLANLQKCVAKSDAGSVQRPDSSSTTDPTSGSLGTDADEANLVPVVPACLGAVSFRQQQVEVRPRAASAGSAGAPALAGGSGTNTPGAGVLAEGCGGDGPAGTGAGSGNLLLLRPGVAFELRVQLYDSSGAPVRAGERGARGGAKGPCLMRQATVGVVTAEHNYGGRQHGC